MVETFGSLLTGQFNLQFTRAKSAWGLTSRVISKVTSLTLAAFLNYLLGKPLLHIKELLF